MIVHDEVLDRICRHLAGERNPFRSKWSNLIARWCVEHWQGYQRAPKQAIETYFTQFAESSQDEDTVEILEAYLGGLSDDLRAVAKEMNEAYVIDLASKHFQTVRLEKTIKAAQAALEKNDAELAEVSLTTYEKIQFASTDWIDPFDPEVIKRALRKKEDQELIKFPGYLGEFLSPHFERDGFIAFAGPEKRGKSYWLSEVVWQAVKQRRRVLYYVVGDMSENQLMRRLLCRVARRPLFSQVIKRPIKIRKKKDEVRVIYEEEEMKGLSPKLAYRAMKMVLAQTAASEPRLKIKCKESSTLSAGNIEADIGDLAKQGWLPDVVVIDYADILLPESHSKTWDYRHQINETWKVLRRISQKYHLLLVTATQTAATSYNALRIRKGDFSEDKRKAAHVTGMLGINQTASEKQQGIYRLNWVFLRDGAWADNQQVHTAGNLYLACPCIISTF